MSIEIYENHIESIKKDSQIKYVNCHALPIDEDNTNYNLKYEHGRIPSKYSQIENLKNKNVLEEKFKDCTTITSTMGSTFLNYIAILSKIKNNSNVLLDINAHKSIFETLNLFQPNIDYIINKKDGIPIIDIDSIDESKRYDLIIITNGSYEGDTYNMKKILNKIDKMSDSILVDEAWNFLLFYKKNFEEYSTLKCLDEMKSNYMIVHSIHKVLPCMRQGSIMSIKGNKEFQKNIIEYRNKFHTTSPNLNIFMSIVKALEYCSNDKVEKLFKQVEKIKSNIKKLDSIKIINNNVSDYSIQNPVKLKLKCNMIETKIFYEYLKKEKIHISYISDSFVMLHILINISDEEVNTIINALNKLNKKVKKSKKIAKCIYPPGRMILECEGI